MERAKGWEVEEGERKEGMGNRRRWSKIEIGGVCIINVFFNVLFPISLSLVLHNYC